MFWMFKMAISFFNNVLNRNGVRNITKMFGNI